MIGSIFKQDVLEATGSSWEKWVAKLDREVNPMWSHEQIRTQIRENSEVSNEWSEWIALLYGQLLGRVPVGVTKDAGIQIGFRKTYSVSKQQAWDFFMSPEGLELWIGKCPSFRLAVGSEYESVEGISGKITVVESDHKLRLTWKRPEWDKPSRLQLYFLSTASGKTTIAIHQEMLEDVYIREIMRRHWEERLNAFKKIVEKSH